MKVTTIGGGPGGLYASLLLKKTHPDWEITVYEKNPEGVTYGWGIVFPNRTLSNLDDADSASQEAITERYDLWEPFDIVTEDGHFRCGGNTFASMMRTDLLEVLQERCRELGVNLEFEAEIDDPAAMAADADLCIAADGINSRTRTTFDKEFGTEITQGSARFSWFGTEKQFDALTHIFVENEDGLWCAHTYPGPTSTFIIDCDADTWAQSGVAEMSEQEYLNYFEDVFAEHLDDYGLKSQQDRWRQFQTVTNENWYHDNIVLVGDAAHTAHYSIGSGTTLAMEDAIGLMEAFEDVKGREDVEDALSTYESSRQPFVESLLSAAERSRLHFEEIDRYYDLPARQFAIHHLTRSGRLTYDSLARRDPEFIDAFDDWFAGHTPNGASKRLPGQQPAQLVERVVSNRFVRAVEPSSSADDGMPSDEQQSALASAAATDPGLVLSEPLAVASQGRPVIGSPGLYTDAHAGAWADVVNDIADDVVVGAQLTHAGVVGGSEPPVFDYGPLTDRESAWARRLNDEYPTHPRALDISTLRASEREAIVEDFVTAARRAIDAGFDYVQLQASSSSVLSQSLTASDVPLDDRVSLVKAVVGEVEEVVSDGTPLGVTLPVADGDGGGLSLDEAITTSRELAAAGVDLVAPVDVTSGDHDIDERGASDFSDDIRNEVDVKTLATAPSASADKVNTLVATGRADLCVVQGTALTDN